MSSLPPDDFDDQSIPHDTRRARIIERAAVNNVPLNTILVTIFVIVAVFFTGKLLYRLRDLVMLLLVGGFIALILNPWSCDYSAGGSNAVASRY